jgi:4-diphosphocytidyl-2-C-methyl-D-erythritol kinase
MTINSYAKINIFLKIVGRQGEYHKINSRFMLVKDLYDTISFSSYRCDRFTIEGSFGCDIDKNTIYRVYNLLKEDYPEVKEFFLSHRVIVDKTIPEFAGLGGGSSNAAAFLNLINRVLKLGASKEYLANLGAKVGSDIPFFVYEYKVANVSGVGEVVREYFEDPLSIEVSTPIGVKPSTKDIYELFRASFFDTIDIELANRLMSMDSLDIIKAYRAEDLNDLLKPCISLYPELKSYMCNNSYLSGSGSSIWVAL